MKQSVYDETSIISYLVARPSRDLRVMAWQEMTAAWWQTAPEQYDLYVSELVRLESERGDADAANRRLSFIDKMRELKNTQAARALADRFLTSGALPANAREDAAHVALAAVHGMDFLLTWNCRHINNPQKKPQIRRLCEENGVVCSEICTPFELMGEETRL
jgi:hypothetical protein